MYWRRRLDSVVCYYWANRSLSMLCCVVCVFGVCMYMCAHNNCATSVAVLKIENLYLTQKPSDRPGYTICTHTYHSAQRMHFRRSACEIKAPSARCANSARARVHPKCIRLHRKHARTQAAQLRLCIKCCQPPALLV